MYPFLNSIMIGSGGAIEPLYNALGRDLGSGGPKPVVARHEAGAAFMAEGYYRKSGKIGVVCATNLLTGVASAYTENTPMLFITPQSALKYFGLKTFQDSHSTGIDTVNIFKNCTNYSVLISHAEQFKNKLETALQKALYPSKGPVHLSIPKDIFDAPVTDIPRFTSDYINSLIKIPKPVDLEAIETFLQRLLVSKNVVIVLGKECEGAIESIVEFASRLGARIVTTCEGKRWATKNTPGYCGVFGFAGHASAYDALLQDNTDCIIAIGSRMTEFSTGSWDEKLLNQKLIHIDNYLNNFTYSKMARLQLFGDIKSILDICNKRLPARPNALCGENKIALQDNSECDVLSSPVKPQHLMKEIVSIFPDETHYVIDIGNSFSWATHYLMPKNIDKYDSSMDFASMGWSIGTSIGIALANRDTPVVCIVGDGSFLMNGNELSVAVEYNLNIYFVILNDSSLGMVKHGQRLSGAEQICHTLPQVDFNLLAKSMKATGVTIKSIQDLKSFFVDNELYQNGPCVLDVYIDGE